MGMVQEGQPILKEQWSKWHAESIAQKEAQENQGIDFDMASVNSDSTVLYDIDANMILDHNIVECECVQSVNVVEDLQDIIQLYIFFLYIVLYHLYYIKKNCHFH